ncbi:transglycosylase SLT domain-containing protein [Bradyrhizobium sp. ARR65]|uniref:transglycosylase SLT domain-containing protein n=1 Tax=Bradyrhizobium sp. ARR65 TaxID=1040989 RepID=UPI000A441D21|nr:transglycosylase SLT domain-containing protein [Bradyrhizobium sp. ARR65]
MQLGLAAALTFVSAPLRAGTEADKTAAPDEASKATETPSPGAGEPFPARAAVRALIEKETATTELPADIAEVVVFVESGYDSGVIGRLGEVGLMQVRPETAAMLGFKGTTAELAEPEINIHYGVAYLAQAWRLAQGDLCRALMKYRAGHGEETMTARSVIYCNRARNRLIAMNSPFALPGAVAAVTPASTPARAPATAKAEAPTAVRPTDAYAVYKHGTNEASRAFWAMHEARIRAINASIEAKWRRVASR